MERRLLQRKIMASKENKKVVVPTKSSDIQRFKLEKLMKKADKAVYIPEKSEQKLPRVFNPPDFIRNVWGSSAGAGSGDFHVYRGVRRREYARQKFNNEMAEVREKDDVFQKKVVQNLKAAEEKTSKKRAKRLKKKQKQIKQKSESNEPDNHKTENSDHSSGEDF